MAKRKQTSRAALLTRRSLLEALDDLVDLLNRTQGDGTMLVTVRSPEQLRALRQNVKSLRPLSPRPGTAVQTDDRARKPERDSGDLDSGLAAIATNIWRTKNKMIDSHGEVKEEMRRAFRHVEAAMDAMSRIGVEVRDTQGGTYDSGLALKVVSFEPTPGLSKEEIKETISPTVTRHGRLIQMGEVIVGTPQAT